MGESIIDTKAILLAVFFLDRRHYRMFSDTETVAVYSKQAGV
jgi:hypothetical protein